MTALAIIDRESLHALSLTAVAAELGIRPSALYTYFDSVEALRYAVAVQAMINLTGNERFVMDSYRRFIQMFGDVVMGVPHHDFETQLDAVKKRARVELDTDLTVDDLHEVVKRYKDVVKKVTGKHFPEDPIDQLYRGIDAVFGSWNNPRAIRYREPRCAPACSSGSASRISCRKARRSTSSS